jgi:hypothetical protein
LLHLDRTKRIALFFASIGVMLLGIGLIAAQGSPDPVLGKQLDPTPAPADTLKVGGLGNAFAPLVTYHALTAADKRDAQSRQTLTLCMTLSGRPAVAVFSIGSGFDSKFARESVAGYTIADIGEGWVHMTDGTTLVQSNCASANGEPQATPPPLLNGMPMQQGSNAMIPGATGQIDAGGNVNPSLSSDPVWVTPPNSPLPQRPAGQNLNSPEAIATP